MLRKIREAQEKEEGFTLIELLVVVIIIGILAAIAIPVFLNQRENGWRAAAESDARNAALGVESFLTRTTAYPVDGADLTDTAVLGDDAVETSNQVTLDYTLRAAGSSAPGTYCIVADNTNIAGTAVDAFYDSNAGGIQKPIPADTSCA